MSKKCRNPPVSVQRQLRQEAGFGCAICGNPLIENAHIIKYSLTGEFPPEDMVVLCPDHHTEADLGKWPEWVLRKAKREPFNKNRQTIGKRFLVTGDRTIVNLGTNKFIDTHRIMTTNDFDLISITKQDDGFLSLDVNLFDILNGFIAIIHENNWLVDKRYAWDIQYKPQHLKIYCASRNILFDVEIKNEEVFITGRLYFNGFPIIIDDESINIGGNVITGSSFSGSGHAIDIRL